MSASRTLVLENLPPVVRITFENGTIVLTAQNSEPSTVATDPPSPSRESPSLRVGQVWRRRDGIPVTVVELMPSGRARCTYFTDDACLVEYYVWADTGRSAQGAITSPHDLVELLQDVPTAVPVQEPAPSSTESPAPPEASFQITVPGRYRLRDGQEVDLLPLPSESSYYEDGFRWYGIIPSESQEGWTTTNQDHSDCDTWTPDGRWFGPFRLGIDEDWDVVAGPLPVALSSLPEKLVNHSQSVDKSQDNPPSNGCAGCGEPLTEQDSCPACVEEQVESVTPTNLDEEDIYLGSVPCVPPVVGRRFRMRNGKTVIVTKQDTDDWYPFDNCDAGKEPWKSLRIESDEKFARCWTAEGHHDLDESKQPYVSGYDLVEDLGSVIPRVPESTSSSAQEPFQIKEPGWYRFRNGTLVELRARTPNDRDRSRDHAYSWFAVNPVRDLTHSCQPVQTQGYDLANVLRHPWWRTDGSYLDLTPSPNLWCDVVSGPFPAPVPEPVRTFPSWLHPNYNFVARDEDGTWYAYGKRPVKDEESGKWNPQDDDGMVIRLRLDQIAEEFQPRIVPDVPWYDSLIERPSVTS